MAYWLAVYVPILGAVEYAAAQGWIPDAAMRVLAVLYYPILWTGECDVSPADCLRWCYQKGIEHRAAAD